MERDDLVRLADAELLRQCKVDLYRASGPGGQKRNKTSSAVRLRHVGTGVSAHAHESRSQAANRATALARLREHLAFDLRREIEDPSIGPELAALLAEGLTRRRSDKARGKIEYLIGAAWVLDVVVACGCRVSEAAERLGVSTGALSHFLLADPRLARRVNELRAAKKMRPLRG